MEETGSSPINFHQSIFPRGLFINFLIWIKSVESLVGIVFEVYFGNNIASVLYIGRVMFVKKSVETLVCIAFGGILLLSIF